MRAMREFLEKIANTKPVFDENTDYFPTDYQDTFDAGVEHGRIELAKELLKAMELAKELSMEWNEAKFDDAGKQPIL